MKQNNKVSLQIICARRYLYLMNTFCWLHHNVVLVNLRFFETGFHENFTALDLQPRTSYRTPQIPRNTLLLQFVPHNTIKNSIFICLEPDDVCDVEHWVGCHCSSKLSIVLKWLMCDFFDHCLTFRILYICI